MSSAKEAPRALSGPGAWLSADSARFVFAVEPHLVLEWDTPDSTAYEGRPEYAWEVSWEPEPSERGRVPDGLWLVTYRGSGGPKRGSLAEMLRPWPAWVMTVCMDCDGASTATEDSALTAEVMGGHVAFVVRGAAGIDRIFPSVPDSVRLTRRRLGSGDPDFAFVVPVNAWLDR